MCEYSRSKYIQLHLIFLVSGNTMFAPESAFMTSERKRSLDSLHLMAEVTAAFIAHR
jgi:hypothetical protein